MVQLTEVQRGIIAAIREFVEKEVMPVASEMEHSNEYPFDLVEHMKEFGLFGAIIPEDMAAWDWTARRTPSSLKSYAVAG